MKTVTTTRVEKVEIKEVTSKKTGKTFYFHEIYGGGQKYTVLRNDSDQIESVGDLVNIAYEPTQNGKYTNNTVKKIEILGEGANDDESPFKQDESNEVSTTQNQQTKTKETKSTTEGDTTTKLPVHITNLTTRDISMEVSGIVQALLSTGHYHQLDNEEGRDKIFIKEGLLEEHIRRALRVKRKLSSELEQTGTV